MASSEDEIMNTEEVEDDLFGDDDDEPAVENLRELIDEDLDSEDDDSRDDRVAKASANGELQPFRDQDATIDRLPLPKPLNGELNALRMPKFLAIEPHAFSPDTFKIPTSDHYSDTKSSNFSAGATAATTMRFRKDHSTGKLESNTNIYKWSDGSTTICVGDQHYELQTKPLAPPLGSKPYKEVEDSHQYLAAPMVMAGMLLIFGHMTNQYTVRPNKDIEDDALERLQKSLAAAARGGGKGDDKNGPELITNIEDPELQKKKAEMAEKERKKAQSRRERAAEKASLPSASSRGRAGGLTVDDLEGRSGRRGPKSGRQGGAGTKRPRRRADYDTDDDDLPQGRGREDEYDKNDDFLADSDEELEEVEGDDDEEEMLDDESEREEPRAKKQKSSRPVETSDADADAETDLDDEDAPAAPITETSRGRKRNVIEDDDDDE